MISNQEAKTLAVVDKQYHIKNICLSAGKSSRIYVSWDNIYKEVYAVKVIPISGIPHLNADPVKMLSTIHN